MAKACRTCKWASPRWRCAIRHKYLLGREIMQCHGARETPLVVDALAEVVAGMMDAMTGSWYVYRKIPGTEEVDTEIVRKAQALITRAHVLLARHKEEVGDACPFWLQRETPLLVDELAKTLQDLWDSRFTDSDTSGQYPCGCDLYNTVMLTPEQGEIIQAALARYKEEVGDA